MVVDWASGKYVDIRFRLERQGRVCIRDSLWGVLWDNYEKKWSRGKVSKKESKKVMQGTRFAAEAGVSGGGGGFTSELC